MILDYFTPDQYIRSYRSLNLDWLKSQGIQLLILDIDNTLAAHDELDAGEEARAFVQKVKASGLKTVVISNNNEERVSRFAKSLDVPYYSFATKPLKRTYRRLLKDYQVRPSACAVLGDQLLTDIFGGRRMKMKTILTTPLVTRDITWTKFNRVLENQMYRLLEKTRRLKRGSYDE